MNDEFKIWQRLLFSVQKEIQSDIDGIARIDSQMTSLTDTKEWLLQRLSHNREAEAVLIERAG